MPPIILTPGTFNPPATPVEHAGIYLFAKQPDVTLNRRPQQSSRSRVAGFPPLPVLPPNIGSIVRDYFTGQSIASTEGMPLEPSHSTITLTGTRYIPNGSYSVLGLLGNGYEFHTPPWSRPRESIQLGAVPMYIYFLDGVGSRAALVIRIPWSVALAANGDGADYEASVRIGNQTPIVGIEGVFDFTLSAYYGSSTPGGFINEYLPFHFQLTRNGVVCDTSTVLIKITGTAVATAPESAVVGSFEEAITYIEADFGMPEVLYGGGQIIPSILGPELPIWDYSRCSIVAQGRLTLL